MRLKVVSNVEFDLEIEHICFFQQIIAHFVFYNGDEDLLLGHSPFWEIVLNFF